MKTGQPHDRHDPSHPLLRELVLVMVFASDGTKFQILLTRVPGIGEEIVREAKSYKIVKVQHFIVDDDGRAAFGWHAFVDVELQPEEEYIPQKRDRIATSPKKPRRQPSKPRRG